MLYFWGFYWDTVVDDWNMVSTVVSGCTMVSWGSDGMAGSTFGFSNGSEMGSFGMLNFSGIDWNTVVDNWNSVVCSGVVSWGIRVT